MNKPPASLNLCMSFRCMFYHNRWSLSQNHARDVYTFRSCLFTTTNMPVHQRRMTSCPSSVCEVARLSLLPTLTSTSALDPCFQHHEPLPQGNQSINTPVDMLNTSTSPNLRARRKKTMFKEVKPCRCCAVACKGEPGYAPRMRVRKKWSNM